MTWGKRKRQVKPEKENTFLKKFFFPFQSPYSLTHFKKKTKWHLVYTRVLFAEMSPPVEAIVASIVPNIVFQQSPAF